MRLVASLVTLTVLMAVGSGKAVSRTGIRRSKCDYMRNERVRLIENEMRKMPDHLLGNILKRGLIILNTYRDFEVARYMMGRLTKGKPIEEQLSIRDNLVKAYKVAFSVDVEDRQQDEKIHELVFSVAFARANNGDRRRMVSDTLQTGWYWLWQEAPVEVTRELVLVKQRIMYDLFYYTAVGMEIPVFGKQEIIDVECRFAEIPF